MEPKRSSTKRSLTLLVLCSIIAYVYIVRSVSRARTNDGTKQISGLPSAPSILSPGLSLPLSEISAALQSVAYRREVYQQANKGYSWPLRGIGYLYEIQGVVLLGELAITPTLTRNTGKNFVRIYNVKNSLDCSKISIWVRVNGPEIFAGHAKVIIHAGNSTAHTNIHYNENCYWEFEFHAKKPGSYSVDAKVLEWNPISKGPMVCKTSLKSSLVDPFPVHESFFGFKLYFPTEMCCEICSRLAGHCQAWSTPISAFPKDEVFRRGCTLYFSNTSDYAIPYSTMLNENLKGEINKVTDNSAPVTYGLPHGNPTTYFLGCGWSYWFTLDFPCLSADLDDRVFFTNNTFTLISIEDEKPISGRIETNSSNVVFVFKNQTMSSEETQPQIQLQSLCTIDTESLEKHNGRWVREPWPANKECPNEIEIDNSVKEFEIAKFEGNRPLCWRREDLSIIGNKCMEMNCQLVDKTSIWRSSVHEEKQWYGRWEHDSGCSYSELTDDQLQTCVDRRKLFGFEVKGKSIAEFLSLYVRERLKNINLYDNRHYGNGTKVTLSTFEMLHFCRLKNLDLRHEFENTENISDSNEEFFWVSTYFLSSERELLCTASRMSKFNVMAEQILQPKGYKMINAFDMSAAFTYDSATQNDGMHIIGPTMKMIITKVLHYLCLDEHDG